MTHKSIQEAMKELPFLLSGEYRHDCGCEHCSGIGKNIKTALSALKVMEWIFSVKEKQFSPKDGTHFSIIQDKFSQYQKEQ